MCVWTCLIAAPEGGGGLTPFLGGGEWGAQGCSYTSMRGVRTCTQGRLVKRNPWAIPILHEEYRRKLGIRRGSKLGYTVGEQLKAG